MLKREKKREKKGMCKVVVVANDESIAPDKSLWLSIYFDGKRLTTTTSIDGRQVRPSSLSCLTCCCYLRRAKLGVSFYLFQSFHPPGFLYSCFVLGRNRFDLQSVTGFFLFRHHLSIESILTALQELSWKIFSYLHFFFSLGRTYSPFVLSCLNDSHQRAHWK